jgi:hypothetical protein
MVGSNNFCLTKTEQKLRLPVLTTSPRSISMTDEIARSFDEPRAQETPEVSTTEATCSATTPKRRGRTGKPLPEMVEGGRLFAEMLRRTWLRDDFEGYIPCVWTVATAQYAAECNPEFMSIRRALSVQFSKGLSAAGLQGHTLSGGTRVWTLPGAVERFEAEYGCSPLSKVHPQFRLHPGHVKRRKRATGEEVEPSFEPQSSPSDKSVVPGFEAGSFLSRVATSPIGAYSRQTNSRQTNGSVVPRPDRLVFPFVVPTFDAVCTVFRAASVDDLLSFYEDRHYELIDHVMARTPRLKNRPRKGRKQAVEPDASMTVQSDMDEGNREVDSGEEGELT